MSVWKFALNWARADMAGVRSLAFTKAHNMMRMQFHWVLAKSPVETPSQREFHDLEPLNDWAEAEVNALDIERRTGQVVGHPSCAHDVVGVLFHIARAKTCQQFF